MTFEVDEYKDDDPTIKNASKQADIFPSININF